jgi:hypothetical protein
MSASFRVPSPRGAALVLALGLAIPLTALGRGVAPAVADPATTTTTATTTRTPVTTTNSTVTTTTNSVVTTPTASSTPTTTTTQMTSLSTASTTTDRLTSSLVATATSTSVTLKLSGTTTVSDAVSSTPSQVIPTAAPQTLTADPQGIQWADAANPTRRDPAPATEGDVRLLNLARNRSNRDVLQLDRGLITYDIFSRRPVIINPFGRALYIFLQAAGGVIQEVVIPAFGTVLTEITQRGPNPVTGILHGDTGEPDQVTAGVINGGGYAPGPDQPPPPALSEPTEYQDVCVAVRYGDTQYKPFIVRKIVDVGDDQQYGEHEVLLDGVTPAWGAWTQSAECGTQFEGRRFEVHKAQQLPGVDEPTQLSPPAGYPVELVTHSTSSGFGKFLVLAALIIAALILAAVLVAIIRAKIRPHDPDKLPRHSDRIRAVARLGSPPVVTARETPAPGEATHAIRLATQFDPGSPTIREVDDDLSPIG